MTPILLQLLVCEDAQIVANFNMKLVQNLLMPAIEYLDLLKESEEILYKPILNT